MKRQPTYGHTIIMQTLDDYIKAFGDTRAYEEWDRLWWLIHTRGHTDKRASQRAAFMQLFPDLTVPDLPYE